MSVSVVTHPVVQERLTDLRNQQTERALFRAALHEVARFVVYESVRDLSVSSVTVDSPMGPALGVTINEPPVLVPVLRAGLGMLGAALELLPDAPVGFIGLRRNEDTLLPESYLDTVPDDLDGRSVLVLDPMLATGGSLLRTCQLLADANAGTLRAACVLAAPEGLDALAQSDLDIIVHTASIDDGLNDQAFILPGLGDAGDRQFDIA
ncbi:MAG: uracil phosphoribosyltransferase [Acidimicrobiales bacterium]